MAKMWIPADRFVALLDQHHITPYQLGHAGAKRMSELRRGDQESLSLEVADRILTRLGLAHWFHVPAAEGGFADIYESTGETYEPEWLAAKRLQLNGVRRKPSPRKTKTCECGALILPRSRRCVRCYRESVPRKYRAPEEYAEANRERARRKARSKGNRCPECGTSITNNARLCRACHLASIEPRHGTVSRYASQVHRCRCDLCTAASARYHRERQHAMRAAYKEMQRMRAA